MCHSAPSVGFLPNKGHLAVLLSQPQIYVAAVTYDHDSKTIAMGISIIEILYFVNIYLFILFISNIS
jgi:hypothetical protein